MQQLVIGGVYRHYKDQLYRVLTLAKHSETMEDLVIYECLYPNELGQIWARPKEMFLGEIVVGGQKRARFQLETRP
jgi:hypothetical protein